MLWLYGFLFLASSSTIRAQNPLLSVAELATQQIRLAWPATATGFVLEETAALSTPTIWSEVQTAPQTEGGEWVVLITPSGTSQFFRLRQTELTRIAETSPANGEGGVAVTRETIVRFSRPLAASTLIGNDKFYAEFGGRKILSRIQLSSDRRTLTLFYLEPLPASARVRVTLKGDGLKDESDGDVDVDGDIQAGGTAFIDFDTLSITAVGQTAVIGRVFASELMPGAAGAAANRPLAGVTVTVDGAEETLRTTTDAMGNFRLQPAPAGRFFVKVDGHTAEGSQWPNGSYYPEVGKAWEAIAGRQDNLAGGTGEIYLPLIRAGTLQTVSVSQDTPVTFPPEVLQANPGLKGVVITVPAGSLISDNGTVGGRVGIAPVPPDRLPEPLPPGLDFPIVITVQTDGPSNFDRPVPVRFPNLPDPVTGVKLPAGAKSALWSFNHDTGKWEIQGPMTVSADGNFLDSDPGVGIRQPGWHGGRPGTQGESGPAVREPPCPDLSAWQVAELVFNIGKEAADCAAGLLGVKQGLQCLLNVIKTGGNLLLAVKKVIEDVTSRPPVAGIQVVKDAISQVKAQKEQMVGLMDCFQAQSPIGKAEAIFNCVGNLLGIAQTVCGALNPDPNAPERCQPSFWTKTVCKGIDIVKTIHSGVADIIKILKDAQEKLALTAVCVGLNQAEAIVGSIAAGGQAPGGQLARLASVSDPFPADKLDEFVASLRQGVTELDIFMKAAAPTGEMLARIESFEGMTLKEFREQAGTMIRAQGEAYNAPVFYLMRYNGIERRGKTSAQGTFDLILPPDADYFLAEYDPVTNAYGDARNITNPNGMITELLPVILTAAANLPDGDGDGLVDAAEDVIGTDRAKADTDGDGISDLAEVRQGSNPLSGLIVSTGIIATANTPGNSVDVFALNDLAITANESGGITVFNVFSGLNPTVVAQVNTPGTARRVAASGVYAAVAADSAGLVIVDLSDPPAASIIHQVNLGGRALSVAAAGGFAFAGTSSGDVVLVDMPSGSVLSREDLREAVQDLVFSGDFLYVLTERQLHVLEYLDGSLTRLGLAESPSPVGVNQRLFVGGSIAYATHSKGYNTFDISFPDNPRLITAGNTTQFGWKQIVANGSGLGLAAVSPNSTFDGPHEVSLYDVTNPANTAAFLTEFETPGVARAVTLYNGLGYVADGQAGLQVLNYQAFDTGRIPPTVQLTTSTSAGFAEEGKLLRVTAKVSDDVQVRNVEFLLNNQLIATDGGFPFEVRFPVPPIQEGASTLRLRAKATDTGGNSTWTEEFTLQIIPDATPPRVRRTVPFNGALAGAVRGVAAFFSEPISSETVTDATVILLSAGADGSFGTADDAAVTGTLEYRDALNAVFLQLPDRLVPGNYRLTIRPPVGDLAGNPLASAVAAEFRVFSFIDDDQDGLPDEVEAALGLNPNNPDSDGDGILDGLEDLDNDGLSNAGEIFAETDPSNRDSDGDGILDGAEDPDGDGLNNLEESIAGTLPLVADTDGDGWNDETEVTGGSDPSDPASRPRLLFVGRPPVSAMVISQTDRGVVAAGMFVGRPPVSMVVSQLEPGVAGSGIIVGRPPVQLHLVSLTVAGSLSPGSYVARPPVTVLHQSSAGSDESKPVVIARPPVEVRIEP